ncbi:MAG TPA: hypothetical protein PLW99_01175 [Candidatus Paceibacterota bacterium]|nr:MAG: hypothetical protein B7X03_01285 [Parcubacteria group bacterium 21-58-10]HQT82745.1 hypothetical protein [Candidatus Paceibacterota bacterium]
MTKKLAAALGIVGFLASAGAAFAQTTTTATAAPTAAAAQPMVLQVGPKGEVLLRGTVTAATASSVTVQSWGGDWTVNVPTTAEVLPQGTVLTDYKTGDFVGVAGTIDQTSGWTVTAKLVRDWTARRVETQQIKANTQALQQVRTTAPRNTQGTLSNLDATAQTFTLTTADGTAYSVSLSSGALLLAVNRATLDFTKVNNGDTVRVYGTVTPATGSAGASITASVFRDVSVK